MKSAGYDRLIVSGRGAAWLARLLGVQEVPGSNPGGPTSESLKSILAPVASSTSHAKTFNKTRSTGLLREEIPRPLVTWQSSFVSASRIMPGFAWL